MVNIGTLKDLRAALGNSGESSARPVTLSAAADGFEALANGLSDGGGHGLASLAGQELGELVGFRVFDVEAHFSTILEVVLPVYHDGDW